MIDLPLEAARWALGDLPSEELPRLAQRALECGMDSECVIRLAIEDEVVMPVVGPLFLRWLAEAGVPIPSERDACARLARHWAEQIVTDAIAPYEGAKRLEALSDATGQADDLLVFVGLVSEYDDFSDSVRLDYYGAEECARVRNKMEMEIVEHAQSLLADEKNGD